MVVNYIQGLVVLELAITHIQALVIVHILALVITHIQALVIILAFIVKDSRIRDKMVACFQKFIYFFYYNIILIKIKFI